MRMCAKHVGVCLQTSVFVSNLCVSMHICVFVCVCMNAQAQFCLVKVISISHPTVSCLTRRRFSVPTVIRMWAYILEFTGACEHVGLTLTVYEFLLQFPAAACT